MSKSRQGESSDAPLTSSTDCIALIAKLRMAGADRFDAMRWHYIEALAKRAMTQQENVKRILDVKLLQTLEAFQTRIDRERCDAQKIVTRGLQQYPHAADELQRLFTAGDFRKLRQFAATLEVSEQCASLASLVRRLDQQATESADARSHGFTGSRSELKTIRNFRKTWSKLSVDKQVSQALQQAPKNAGPINSHMLMLRSLTLMRDIAPDYLNHFMSYADTLLCLDQSEREKSVTLKKTRVAKK